MESKFVSKRLEEAKKQHKLNPQPNNALSDVESLDFGKKLAWILRHEAVEQGLNISTGGYVLCSDILNMWQFRKFTLDDIKNEINTSTKKRYVLMEKNNKLYSHRGLEPSSNVSHSTQLYIKAIMGHTGSVLNAIILEDLYVKITEPIDEIFCITSLEKYNNGIATSGLKVNKRWNIEFTTPNLFNGNNTGEILIYIDMESAIHDGIKFFMAENDIIISKGTGSEYMIDSKYFTKVIDITTGKDLLK